jgi:inner membrane protein
MGHLPAGYLWTRALARRTARWADLSERDYARLLAVGLASSVLPDLDLLYFYLVDGRRHLHHGYWTHIPLFWTLIFAAPLALLWAFRRRLWLLTAAIYTNLLLHMALDTVVGKIRWLYPFSREDFYVFEVPARYGWAYANFILHWTFLLEIGVVAWALALVYRDYGAAFSD